MTPIVSVLLPTIRPDLFRIRMQEYARLDVPGPCEVIVVTDLYDLEASSPCPWLSVTKYIQPRGGNVPATNLAFEHAAGRYVIATNDEVEFDRQILTALVAAGEAAGERALLSGTQTPYCSNDYYGVFFANCPFGRKSFFQSLDGGFFDPVYRCFYADPDLALRCDALGISVTKVPEARCTHHCVKDAEGHVSNRRAYYAQDRGTFEHRWAHLGDMAGDPSSRSRMARC